MKDWKERLIGQKLLSMGISPDGYKMDIVTEVERVCLSAEGDCCSSSWIEGVEGMEIAVGGEITAIDDITMPDMPGNIYDHYEEEMTYYGLRINTTKGSVVIDYRNSSNGYYGGWLEEIACSD